MKTCRGLGDFHDCACQGQSMTVVFFGGSLTWGANASDPNRTSYRGLICEKLRRTYPHTPWKFIDAAIGGTGSQLGIYRLERDVIAQKPDLVFLDFTLNDGMTTVNPETLSSYEAIVRGILERAKCPVVLVFLAARDHVTVDSLSKLVRRTNHLKLARHYNLAVGDAVKGMHDMYRRGCLTPETIWLPELFDTYHPHDKGYELYARFVWQGLQKGIRERKTPVLPSTWLTSNSYENQCRYDLETWPGLTARGWHVGYPESRAGTFDFLCSRWMHKVAIAGNCRRTGFDQFHLTGARPQDLTFTFRGSNLLLFGESTIFSGKLRVEIDGVSAQELDAASFGAHFAPSAYLCAPIVDGLDPQQDHTLTIHPLLSETEPQEIHLASICISGPEDVWVQPQC